MKTINKNNYEAFLLDYFEGNLSSEMRTELMLFLENNPDLQIDLNDLDFPVLDAHNVTYPFKNELKKSSNKINTVNYESYIISEIEGLNNLNDTNLLQEFLKNNPDKQKEFLRYQKTILQAPTINFNNKKLLYRKEPILERKKVISLYWWYAVAAIFLVFFVLKSMYHPNNIKNSLVTVQSKLENKQETHNLSNDSQMMNKKIQNNKMLIVNHVPVSIKNQKQKISLKKDITQQKKVIKVDTSSYINDTLKIKSKKIEIAQNLYTDNVKITFDDEPQGVIQTQKKISKISMIKLILKKVTQQKKDAGDKVLTYVADVSKIISSKRKDDK